jgi:hypothetical protein
VVADRRAKCVDPLRYGRVHQARIDIRRRQNPATRLR